MGSGLSSSLFRPTTHRVQVTRVSEPPIIIPPHAWVAFSEGWQDPWPSLTMDEVMDELRGPVAWVADGTVTPALSNAELQAILDEEAVGGVPRSFQPGSGKAMIGVCGGNIRVGLVMGFAADRIRGWWDFGAVAGWGKRAMCVRFHDP